MKRVSLSFIAFIVGLLELIIEICFIISFAYLGNSTLTLSGIYRGWLLIPLPFLLGIAIVLNFKGWQNCNKVFTIISAIIYGLSFFIVPLLGTLALPACILQLITFGKLLKNGY